MRKMARGALPGRSASAAAFAVLGVLLAMHRASADELVLSDVGVITGTENPVYSLSAPGAGTFEVTLSDLVWPQPLEAVDLTATSATGVLGSMTHTGTMTFSVAQAGTYYAHLAAQATPGLFDVGAYDLKVMFQPIAGPAPLPPAGWLLLSGLVAFVGIARVRRHLPAK